MTENSLAPVDACTGQQPVETILSRLLTSMFDGASHPTIVAVGGPGGTGKSFLARRLATSLPDAGILELDHYKTSRTVRKKAGVYGPHPDANRMGLIARHLQSLKARTPFERPTYCSVQGDARGTEPYLPRRFNIVEGEVSTYEDFRRHIDFSIFIDAHWKTQLQTRITRDIEIRGYSPEKAISTFLYSNLREFPEHGMKSREWCDLLLFCQDDYSMRIEAASSGVIHHLKQSMLS